MTTMPAVAESRRPLILVVEDQSIVALDIERSLRSLGYDVLARAANAEDAIARARARRPHLILMDIRLPGSLDGIAAARILRDELQIPVVFLSGFSDADTLERAKATEPFGYIVKPFKEVELRCAIEIALHRCEMEDVARKRERLLETTLRSISDGVVTTDVAGQITFLNRVAEELTGWTTTDATGQPLSAVMRVEDEQTAAPVELPLRRAIAHGSVEYLRPGVVLVGKTGARVPIEDSAAAIIDDDGCRLGGVVVFRDLRARKKAEADARVLEARYRTLFEHALDGIFILSTAGTLLEVNRRAEEIHRTPRAQMIGRHYWDLGSPGTADVERARFAELLTAGVVRAEGVEIVRPDGERRAIDLAASVVALGAEKVIVAIERDVTDQRRAAEQMRQYQRTEALGQLTGGVAHDFNNILSVILANGDFLAGSLEPRDPRQLDVEEIRKAGERGASLTRQLLAFSRQQVLDPKVLDLNTVIVEVEKMTRRLISANIAVTCHLDERLASVRADRGQLEQVVLNLVLNARDAMPRGGTLRFETSNVELTVEDAATQADVRPGPHVMLVVSDTGTGMTAEAMRRAFEPFFTTKERGKGTGLGLATCHGIVKQSGGHITVASERDRGTVFTIYLPSVSDPPERVSGGHVLAGLHGSETILLVEDDDAVRAAIRRIFESHGYRVLAARDGEEALALANAHAGPVHLIVSDVVIPGRSSLDVVKAIRGQRPEVRVLFMSGYAEHVPLDDDALRDGTGFIQKPFAGHAELLTSVRRILDRVTPPAGSAARSASGKASGRAVDPERVLSSAAPGSTANREHPR